MYYPCSENKGADQLVTAKLICIFVFAYADCWFSHEVAHLFVGKHNCVLFICIYEMLGSPINDFILETNLTKCEKNLAF